MPRTRQEAKSARATGKVLKAALKLFSTQGYRATSMRQIAERSRLSLGNLYHHFGGKEPIFEQLLEEYWSRLRDPELPLNRMFFDARFPDDLEDMAEEIERIVVENAPYILLIYIDVIEFRGRHLRAFYAGMAERFRGAYGEAFRKGKAEGRFGDIDPMVGVMVATRWLFYFFTIERCFGVPMHFGMSPDQAVREFIKILRLGVLPRATNRVRTVSAARTTRRASEKKLGR